MAIRSGYKWLVVAVLALAVINLTFLGYMWFGPRDKNNLTGPPKDARDYLVRELDLNTAQQRYFDSLREDHFDQMKRDRTEMRALKDVFFHQLRDSADSTYTELAQQIGAVHTRIELNTFRHFAALRTVCTDEQKKKFDEIIQDVLKNLGRPGPPPGGRHEPH